MFSYALRGMGTRKHTVIHPDILYKFLMTGNPSTCRTTAQTRGEHANELHTDISCAVAPVATRGTKPEKSQCCFWCITITTGISFDKLHRNHAHLFTFFLIFLCNFFFSFLIKWTILHCVSCVYSNYGFIDLKLGFLWCKDFLLLWLVLEE